MEINDYLKQLQTRNKTVAKLLDIFLKKIQDTTFQIQIDNAKYIVKKDFKITCATVMSLYYELNEEWRDHIIGMHETESDSKEYKCWRWEFDDKGKKIYDKINKKLINS